MSKAKAIGTRGETAVVNYLADRGLVAKREVLHGSVDFGDVHCLLPWDSDRLLVIQVKAGRYAETSMEQYDAWLAQAERQAGAAGADLAALVTKVSGRGDARVGDWTLHYREPWGRCSTRLSGIITWLKES